MRRCVCRYHYKSRHYTASIMELDDPEHPELLTNRTEDTGSLPTSAAATGPTFTLYLYDHDVKQTIIRRLTLEQMANDQLNPFIEKNEVHRERRSSLSPSSPSIASPKMTLINGDLVLGGGKADEPGTHHICHWLRLTVNRRSVFVVGCCRCRAGCGEEECMSLLDVVPVVSFVVESAELSAAKAAVQSLTETRLVELRSLYHTEETPLFVVKTLGAVRAHWPPSSHTAVPAVVVATAPLLTSGCTWAVCVCVGLPGVCCVWDGAVVAVSDDADSSELVPGASVLTDDQELDADVVGCPGEAAGWCHRGVCGAVLGGGGGVRCEVAEAAGTGLRGSQWAS